MIDSNTTLHVIDHPLIADMLAEARSTSTRPATFRRLLSRIGTLLAYEATRDLPTDPSHVTTPLETMQVQRVRHPVTLVPILRAGLGMADGIHALMPQAQMGHVGLVRNEETLEPTTYYERLPGNVADGPVLVVDPMLATGGSAIAAVDILKARGCRSIRLISLVAAPEGVAALATAHADVHVYVAALDRELNDKGYILPGLGDAGDRLYGTI